MSATGTTRRGLLASAASTLAAAPLAAATSASINLDAKRVNPALQQCLEIYRSALRHSDEIERQHAVVRAGLVARCGEPGPGRPANIIWQHDPARSSQRALMDESTRANSRVGDAIDELMEVRANAPEDLAVKLLVVLSIWRQMSGATQGFDEYHEKLTFAFLEEAERVLSTPSGSAGT